MLDRADRELPAVSPLPLSKEQVGSQLIAVGGAAKFMRSTLGKDVISKQEVLAFRSSLAELALEPRAAFLLKGKGDVVRQSLGIHTADGARDYAIKLPAQLTLLLRIMTEVGADDLRVSRADLVHGLNRLSLERECANRRQILEKALAHVL